MIAPRESFLYDMPSRTFYAALDPDFVGPPPKTIEIPRRQGPDMIQFHHIHERSMAVAFADIYESREPNSMPYYILLYKHVDLMRRDWRIQRERKR